MVRFSAFLLLFGFGSALLYFADYQFRWLAWADQWQPGFGLISGSIGVVLFLLMSLGGKKEEEASPEQGVDGQVRYGPPAPGFPGVPGQPYAGAPTPPPPGYGPPAQAPFSAPAQPAFGAPVPPPGYAGGPAVHGPQHAGYGPAAQGPQPTGPQHAGYGGPAQPAAFHGAPPSPPAGFGAPAGVPQQGPQFGPRPQQGPPSPRGPQDFGPQGR